MVEFAKKHPYIMHNIVGMILASSAIWFFLSSFVGFWIFVLVRLLTANGVLPVAVIIMNVLGFLAVADNSKNAIAFAAAAGSPGAFIAVTFFNKDYEYRNYINHLFIAAVYFVIWLVLSYNFAHISA